MLTDNEIIDLDRKARRRFTYKADPISKDTWRSHADDVIHDRPWSGDCDDLTSTVLVLCSMQLQPGDSMWRVIVSSTGAYDADHMVGYVLSKEGRMWVVGDTNRPAYHKNQMEYRELETSVCTGIEWTRTER